ncbi:MAG: carbohydrate kinase family protein, partial [Duodenibacillus sp.]|nr:carbohydrate kinase family protein [Duodenibacillus sp.]
MSAFVSGSIAYDTVLEYPGAFAGALGDGQGEIINITFEAASLRRSYGGCGANIACALKLLGGDPVLAGAVGYDGGDYLARLEGLGIRHCVVKLDDVATAQCFITADAAGAQIATFYPGAMLRSALARLPDEDFAAAIVAPDSKAGMLERAEELAARGLPFILDISQAVGLFSRSELRHLLGLASMMILSGCEFQAFCRIAAMSPQDVAAQAPALAVTHGAAGLEYWERGAHGTVPAASAPRIVDPVGAGDALRGGLLYGLEAGAGLARSLRLGAALAALKVGYAGAQGCQASREDVLAQA